MSVFRLHFLITDESWLVVKNTPGVTVFLGSSGEGKKPIMLLPTEINPILSREGLEKIPKGKVEIDFKIGDDIKIINGPFIGQVGKVEEMRIDKWGVIMLVDVFGRLRLTR